MPSRVIIACGALARELRAVIALNGWQDVRLACLPAALHNRPEAIPARVAELLARHVDGTARVFVAYADCGTGGGLDRVLAAYPGVERLPGAHCYAFYAGVERFQALADAEPGSFYLTDFLVQHFERLVIDELGLRQHPELQALYFGNYRRVVYLAQRDAAQLREGAEVAAARLGLPLVVIDTGYGALQPALAGFMQPSHRVGAAGDGQWQV